jgi:hypothetical protein
MADPDRTHHRSSCRVVDRMGLHLLHSGSRRDNSPGTWRIRRSPHRHRAAAPAWHPGLQQSACRIASSWQPRQRRDCRCRRARWLRGSAGENTLRGLKVSAGRRAQHRARELHGNRSMPLRTRLPCRPVRRLSLVPSRACPSRTRFLSGVRRNADAFRTIQPSHFLLYCLAATLSAVSRVAKPTRAVRSSRIRSHRIADVKVPVNVPDGLQRSSMRSRY